MIELNQVRIKGIFTTDEYMYTTTKRTSEIFAIVVVAATALTLLTSTTTGVTPSALAAKGSHGAKSLGTDTASSASNGNNDKMNSLFACESSSAHGSGQLTETGVLDCYLQAFSHSPVSYLSVLPNNVKSNNNTNSVIGGTDSSSGSGSGSGSSSSSNVHSTSDSQHPHHHSSTSPKTSKGSTTSSTGGS